MPGSCSSGFRSRPSAGAGQQAVERVRGQQHEQQEADATASPSPRGCAPTTLARQVAAEAARPRASRPSSISSHSSIEPSWPPQTRGDAVVQRQRAVGVGGDVEHREVVADEAQRRGRRRRTRPAANCVCADGRARAPSSRRDPRAAPSDRHACRARAATPSASQRAKWPISGIMALHFRIGSPDIVSASFGLPCCGAFQRLGGFGRHVVLVVLGEHLAGDEHAVLRAGPGRPRPCLP